MWHFFNHLRIVQQFNYLCSMKDTKDIKTLADLTPDGENFNKHTEFGQKLLEDSLRKFGAGRSILVDKDGNIIAGNSTTETAAAIGMEDVIVVPTDGKKLVVVQRTDLSLDSPEGRELALADNMTALKGIDIDLAKVQETLGDDLAKAWGMEIPEVQKQAQEDDFDPDKPVETVCKKGDIWKLGNHRLMCGDSTDAGSVALLMDGEKADMCFTDPPWNVNYGDPEHSYNPKWKNGRQILNDSMTTDEFKAFMGAAFNALKSALVDGGIVYVVMSAQEWGNLMLELYENGMHWSSTIIWAKDTGVLSRKDYNTQYEPIWYGWKDGASRVHPVKDHTQSDLWQIKRPKRSDEHPTMKPVELVARAIQNSSDKGENIIDLFGGSGTTLIAAEQLNRKCYMMELDPHYCDVIIARWEKLTGNKAERISNGNE